MTGRSGQQEQDRQIKKARTIKLKQGSQEKTARKRKPGHDSQGTGQPGKGSHERTAKTGQLGQESKEKIAYC
jgi:hypothetical protein